MSTTIQGTGGSVTLPTGFTAKLDTWSANVEFKTADTTGFSDSGFQVVEPVLVSMTGSAGGTATHNDTNAPTPDPATLVSGDPAEIVLTAASGKTYTFNCVINKIDFQRPNADKMTVTFNFESDGGIAQAWS